MEIIEINNVNYAVKIHQRNEHLPWLLMLHGFMGDRRVFDHLIDDIYESCNPVTLDLLGHGLSSKPPNPERYQEEKQIKDIARLIRKLNLSPLFLYGYSMGGRLALKTALAHPELFSGLILESTTNGIPDENEKRNRRQIDRDRATQIKTDYEGFLADWEQAPLFQSPTPTDPELLKKYHRIHLEQSSEAMAASLRGFGTGFMTPETASLSHLNISTLLIAGSADEKYQQINQQLEQQLPNAHFSSIEAGHRVHLDNPKELINIIKRHFSNAS